jgi:hypothetical protein
MGDRIKSRLDRIIATHRPPPLAPEVHEKIDAILRAAEAREAQSH